MNFEIADNSFLRLDFVKTHHKNLKTRKLFVK